MILTALEILSILHSFDKTWYTTHAFLWPLRWGEASISITFFDLLNTTSPVQLDLHGSFHTGNCWEAKI